MSSESQAPKLVSLCGMAGLGKTELALEYAYSRQDRFDAVFLINADIVSKLELGLADIAVKLGLEDAKGIRDLAVNRETAKSWLSRPTKVLDQSHAAAGETRASYLIVLDHAGNPNILTEYSHLFGTGSWLITGGYCLPAQTAFSSDAKVLDLKLLDDRTGARLLRRLTGAQHEEKVALDVSTRLEGLPLAIVQMAGMIR